MSSGIDYFQTADGSQLRFGRWRCTMNRTPRNPTVVILQGRASFLEKFEAIITGLCRRGYDVWSFDWRGQGLSTRQLKNLRKGHIDSYDTYLQDMDEIIKKEILTTCQGPLIVLGQSMGSHLALRYMTDYEPCFDLAVLTAPLIDLNTGGYPKKAAQLLSKTAVRFGFGSSFVMGHRVYDPTREPFEGNMLTHDRESFLHHRALQRMNPQLTIGGVTYGWVHATFESIERLTHQKVLEKIKIPTLVIGAGQEVVVNNSRLKEVVSWIPRSELVMYPRARHQILSETQEIMEAFWLDFERFVALNLSTGEYQPALIKPKKKIQIHKKLDYDSNSNIFLTSLNTKK